MSQKDPKFRIAVKGASKDIRSFINQIMQDITKEHNEKSLIEIEKMKNDLKLENDSEISDGDSSEGG